MEIRTGSHRGRSFRFACRPEVHASWWTFEDEKEVRELCWDISPGDIVFDVGSCFGSYTLAALAAGAACVFAWNPLAHENELLRASLEENNWQQKCRVFPVGLHGPELDSVGFPVRTMDSFLPEFGEPGRSWLKLDVEGMEIPVLRGAIGFLRAWKPDVLVECHDVGQGNTETEVVQFMRKLGYDVASSTQYHSVRHVLLVTSSASART